MGVLFQPPFNSFLHTIFYNLNVEEDLVKWGGRGHIGHRLRGDEAKVAVILNISVFRERVPTN